jgi:type IV secretory pathway VirB2 component (pilin)
MTSVVSEFTKFVAVIAVFAIIFSWIMYLLSNWDETKTNKAKYWILYSLIWVIVSVSAWWIINLLNNLSLPTTSGNDWLSMLSQILAWLKSEFMTVVWILVIWVFIYIGFRFVVARWNPEEFKKAWSHLIYAVIWLFFIFIAWWLVKIISSFSL